VDVCRDEVTASTKAWHDAREQLNRVKTLAERKSSLTAQRAEVCTLLVHRAGVYFVLSVTAVAIDFTSALLLQRLTTIPCRCQSVLLYLGVPTAGERKFSSGGGH
jgi:hypothetical protein